MNFSFFSFFSILEAHYMRRFGLVLVFLLVAVELLAYLADVHEAVNLRYLRAFTLGALGMIAFSKEKIDDERVQAIRYFSLKLTFCFLLIISVVTYISVISIDLLNALILSLIVYLIIFHLANRFNPEFVFKEEVNNSKTFNMVGIGIFVFFVISSLYNVVWAIIEK